MELETYHKAADIVGELEKLAENKKRIANTINSAIPFRNIIIEWESGYRETLHSYGNDTNQMIMEYLEELTWSMIKELDKQLKEL